ncbi:MAG: hypothetical protein ACI8XB_000747 [Patiriisocius sp.]|jgi:hypothetical protein
MEIEEFYDFDIDLVFNMTTTSEESTSEMKCLLGIKEKNKEHVYMEVIEMIG